LIHRQFICYKRTGYNCNMTEHYVYIWQIIYIFTSPLLAATEKNETETI
jgi:hypothetical protein